MKRKIRISMTPMMTARNEDKRTAYSAETCKNSVSWSAITNIKAPMTTPLLFQIPPMITPHQAINVTWGTNISGTTSVV